MSDRDAVHVPRRRLLASAAAAIAGLVAFGRVRQAAADTQELPVVGEIRMFAGDFAPVGFLMCDGGLYPMDQYADLFNVIGTMYGGDGQTTFAVPDLRGRIPVHPGPSFGLAESGGSESVVLLTGQLPAHTHDLRGFVGTATSDDPAGRVPATSVAGDLAYAYTTNTTLHPASIDVAGAAAPHTNMQPTLAFCYIIATFGQLPTP